MGAPPPVFGSEKERRNVIPYLPKGGQPSYAEMLCEMRPRHFYLVPRQDRRNAITAAHQGKGQCNLTEMSVSGHPSQPVKGVIVKTQKCRDIVAPRERSWKDRKNATKVPPLPTNHRGSLYSRRNAIGSPPPPNLGHSRRAEMPRM